MLKNTEADEALDIARGTRQMILAEKKDIEILLFRFKTVAQILGRKEDEQWAVSELSGHFEGVPTYRRKVCNLIRDGSAVKKEIIDLNLSIATIYSFIGRGEDPLSLTVSSKLLKELRISSKEAATYSIEVYLHALQEILSSIRLAMLSRLNVMIGEIVYGKIPQGIFASFQDKVNDALAGNNPQAVSELNIAYESMGKLEDPERISHVAFACRRLIKAIADNLYPGKNGVKVDLSNGRKSVDVGDEKFLNRLDAFVDSLESPCKKYLMNELSLLRDLVNEIPESMNKGVHFTITNAGAERLVLYSYMILGDIILESGKAKMPQIT